MHTVVAALMQLDVQVTDINTEHVWWNNQVVLLNAIGYHKGVVNIPDYYFVVFEAVRWQTNNLSFNGRQDTSIHIDMVRQLSMNLTLTLTCYYTFATVNCWCIVFPHWIRYIFIARICICCHSFLKVWGIRCGDCVSVWFYWLLLFTMIGQERCI